MEPAPKDPATMMMMMYRETCLQCGCPLSPPHRSDKVFCGKSCQQKYMRKVVFFQKAARYAPAIPDETPPSPRLLTRTLKALSKVSVPPRLPQHVSTCAPVPIVPDEPPPPEDPTTNVSAHATLHMTPRREDVENEHEDISVSVDTMTCTVDNLTCAEVEEENNNMCELFNKGYSVPGHLPSDDPWEGGGEVGAEPGDDNVPEQSDGSVSSHPLPPKKPQQQQQEQQKQQKTFSVISSESSTHDFDYSNFSKCPSSSTTYSSSDSLSSTDSDSDNNTNTNNNNNNINDDNTLNSNVVNDGAENNTVNLTSEITDAPNDGNTNANSNNVTTSNNVNLNNNINDANETLNFNFSLDILDDNVNNNNNNLNNNNNTNNTNVSISSDVVNTDSNVNIFNNLNANDDDINDKINNTINSNSVINCKTVNVNDNNYVIDGLLNDLMNDNVDPEEEDDGADGYDDDDFDYDSYDNNKYTDIIKEGVNEEILLTNLCISEYPVKTMISLEGVTEVPDYQNILDDTTCVFGTSVTRRFLYNELVDKVDQRTIKIPDPAFPGVVCWKYQETTSRANMDKLGHWRLRGGYGTRYPQVWLRGSLMKNYRALGQVYLLLRGDVSFKDFRNRTPPYDYSHLCHNHWCCNPAHGIAETHKVNLGRIGCASGVLQTCLHPIKCLRYGLNMYRCPPPPSPPPPTKKSPDDNTK